MNTLAGQITQRIQELPTNRTVYQKGVLDGLKLALQIVENTGEPVALTKMQRKIHDFYESHGVFQRIKQWKSEGLSTYAITNQLNLEKIPTFQGKFWNQTQVVRVLKMMSTQVKQEDR